MAENIFCDEEGEGEGEGGEQDGNAENGKEEVEEEGKEEANGENTLYLRAHSFAPSTWRVCWINHWLSV